MPKNNTIFKLDGWRPGKPSIKFKRTVSHQETWNSSLRSLQYSRSVVSSSLKILSRCSAFLRLQTYLNSSPDNFPATQLTSTNNKPSLLGRPPLLLGSPRSYLRACTLVILAPGQLIYPLLLLPHLLVGEVGLNINMCYTHYTQVRTF